MRAIPSPTLSTEPTSLTCASVPKLAIWSLMTFEISVVGEQRFERANGRAKLGETAALRQHTEEFSGQGIDAHLLGNSGNCLRRCVAADDRAGGEAAKISRFGKGAFQRREALRYRIKLVVVAGQFEQSQRVTPA
jgi:hypothetical protein